MASALEKLETASFLRFSFSRAYPWFTQAPT